MSERISESLSALVDGEVDELELRRLLNECENDKELISKWHRYQIIGAVLRDEPVSTVDLATGVMQALDGVPMDEVPAAQTMEESVTAKVIDVAPSDAYRATRGTEVDSSIANADVQSRKVSSFRVPNTLYKSFGLKAACIATLSAVSLAFLIENMPSMISTTTVTANSSNADMSYVSSAALINAAVSEQKYHEIINRNQVDTDDFRQLSKYRLLHTARAAKVSSSGMMSHVRIASVGIAPDNGHSTDRHHGFGIAAFERDIGVSR